MGERVVLIVFSSGRYREIEGDIGKNCGFDCTFLTRESDFRLGRYRGLWHILTVQWFSDKHGKNGGFDCFSHSCIRDWRGLSNCKSQSGRNPKVRTWRFMYSCIVFSPSARSQNVILTFSRSVSICLKYCAWHEKVKRGHTKCCTCHGTQSSVCCKMQPLSGNQHPDLRTSLMKMSLVLRLPREKHLYRSSSNVPRLPSCLKMLQDPHD